MILLYVVIASILLIGVLIWVLKIISTTYLDLYEKGLVALSKQDYQKAKKLFSGSLAKNPDFTDAKYNLALAYLGLEDYEEARAFFEAVLEDTPDDFNTLFNLALVCQLDGHYDEAMEIYEKAILVDPQDVDCYLNIALIHFEKKDYQKTFEFLTMAREMAPDKIEILFTIARCKDELCNYDNEAEVEAVLAEYEALVERKDLPEDFDISLAKAYAKAGRSTQAIEFCTKVVMEDYFNDEALRLLGLLLLIKNDADNARKTILKAIDVEPDIPEAYNLLAYVSLLEKNNDEFVKAKTKYKNILTASKSK